MFIGLSQYIYFFHEPNINRCMYFLSIVPWGLAGLDWIFGTCFNLCLKSKLWIIYLLFVSGKGHKVHNSLFVCTGLS